TALAVGFDFFQGYYFARPAASYVESKQLALARVTTVANQVSELSRAQIEERRREKERLDGIFSGVLATLQSLSPDDFCRALERAIRFEDCLEAAYVLNAHGVQITETLMRSARDDDRRARAFRPAPRG